MYSIDKSIEKAETLPSSFYSDGKVWEICKEKIFGNSWQYLGHQDQLFRPTDNTVPGWILERYLDEPVLLTKTSDHGLKCLSNVCTHRGFLLVQQPGSMRKITCRYHGRRFDLEGKFEFMPEFEMAEDFPRPCDHLHQLPLGVWKSFLFAGLGNHEDFTRIAEQLETRLGFLPVDQFRFAPEYSKTYNIQAHWALYCDNYLEGFHIPFVHNGLNEILDYGSYSTLCLENMVLQIGYAKNHDFVFHLPHDHPDAGQPVAAFYFWIFPNFMLNFYPWGIQVNLVCPVTPTFTKVHFTYYIHDEDLFTLMNGATLAEKTEREDEFVVEAVQRGVRSRYYKSGRFSPKREKGVFHFHQLISQFLLNN